MHRRDFVGLGLATLAAALISPEGEALADGPTRPARPRACILLWMNGGPSHIDTFDPKARARAGGTFKSIKTSAPGIEICEHLPRVAAQAHRLAIVRGMTSKEGNHQRAQQLVHTGYAPSPTVAHPSLGAWASSELGTTGDLPAFVALGGPSYGAGFLGRSHAPLIVQRPGEPPRDVALQVDPDRASVRNAMLGSLEDRFAARVGDGKVAERRAVYDKARRMMGSRELAAFDVSSEPAAVRAAYGDTDFGRGCLAARRLVEGGVRFVEVVLDGWDTHKDNFDRTRKLMTSLDPAMATLVRELAERDLLGSTLVAWMGEFGRTPRIDGDEGRDHHPAAWSAVLAGAGIRGGIAHGQTDADGARVVSGRVGVPDMMATIAHALGLDPSKTVQTPLGRPIAITDGGQPVSALLA